MSPPPIMQLLQAKVPLTLLLDLADADRLPSGAILRREPADLGWLTSPGPGRRTRTQAKRLDVV